LQGYFFSKCALKIFWKYGIFNLAVSGYEADDKNKKDHIDKVYILVILNHMIAQINTGLIENIEITEPLEEIHSNLTIETNNYLNTNAIEAIKESILIYESQPKHILVDKMKKDKNFFNKLQINKYTGKIDTDSLLLLKYNNNDIISMSTIKSLNFHMYMDQPVKWSAVSYNCICRLRNILFLYTNMKDENIKFNASILIKEDKEFSNLSRDIPLEFKFKANAHLIDPLLTFIYKRRMYGFYLAERIFYYRVLLRLILKSISSKDLISNVKTIINKEFIEENLEKKIDLRQKNKDVHINYCKEHNAIYDWSNEENNYCKSGFFSGEKGIDTPLSKKIKIDNQQNTNENIKIEYSNVDFNQRNKIKYWLCNTSYMMMTKNELNDFMTSCIYHQIGFILRNIICKCIDFLCNQYIFYARIAKLKEINMEKPELYEFFSVVALYEIGVVYLSKYVKNHGVDFYHDSVITSFTNIEQLRNHLKDDTYNNNWYIGKQYTSDTYKIKIQNIINTVNQPGYTHYTVQTRPENESLIIMNNKDNNTNESQYSNNIYLNKNFNVHNNYYYNNDIFNNNINSNDIDNIFNNNNKSYKPTINVDYIKSDDGIISICDKILELIYNSEAETKYDLTISQEINDYVDTYYDRNMNCKKYCCKECYRQRYEIQNNKTKENFIELLKILKYFNNIDEYVPQNCDIYKCVDQIDNYLYTDSSIPTFQYFYDELIKIKKYNKEAGEYADNLGYLINKANNAIRFGLDSFDNDVVFSNSFF